MSKVWFTLSFLWWWSIISGCAPTTLTTAAAQFMGSARLTHGPVVGAVTPDAARVFVRTDRPAQVQIMYGTDPKLESASLSAIQTTAETTDWTSQIPLNGLQSNTSYYLNILVDNAPQLTEPYPHFKTFPSPDAAQEFSFVVLTDASTSIKHAPQTFVNAGAENPAFVILGGDFPHGKSLTIEEKRANFKAIYSPATSPSIASFVRAILRQYPVAHVWDDHDFGPDNSDKTFALKNESLQVLSEYFPTYPMSRYGDWQKFRYAQTEIFMLDSRSQRDPNSDPNTLTKSMLDGDHLGADGQWEWLTQGLKESTARWKFIFSPVAFNPTTKPEDDWAVFPAERRRLVEYIQQNHITGVVFLTGDVHIGAIDNGTHSDFPEMLVPGPNGNKCGTTNTLGQWSEGMYAKKGGCHGYGVVTVQTNPDRAVLQVKNADGETMLSYTVSLEP